MLEIDTTTDESFAGLKRNNYIQRKLYEYEKKYPNHFKQAGKEAFAQFIELSLQKAEQYNMMADREVNGLATMMYYLGCSFDTDPMFPWARFHRFPDKVPTDKNPESFAHLENVYSQFRSFYITTCGENGFLMKNALQKVLMLDGKQILTLRSNAEVLDQLSQIYPERFEQLPEPAEEALIQHASDRAVQDGMYSIAGTAVIACLLFFGGIGVENDPLYKPILDAPERMETQSDSKELVWLNICHQHVKFLLG